MQTMLGRITVKGTSFNEDALRSQRQDQLLMIELLQLDETQQEKLVARLLKNGFRGDNHEVVVRTLQDVYIEYDISAFRGHGPESLRSLSLVEQWANGRMMALVC